MISEVSLVESSEVRPAEPNHRTVPHKRYRCPSKIVDNILVNPGNNASGRVMDWVHVPLRSLMKR